MLELELLLEELRPPLVLTLTLGISCPRALVITEELVLLRVMTRTVRRASWAFLSRSSAVALIS